MHEPEQPPVWPPPPTLPPPESVDPPKFAVFVPEWLAYVLRETAPPCAMILAVTVGLDLLYHSPLPTWRSYIIVITSGLTYNGIKYWMKFRKQRDKPGL